MRRAIAYVRLSVADPGGNSIPNQKKRVEEYCVNNGLELLQTFVDDGKTGWNFDRPGFMEMERYCKQRKDVAFLIIPHFDRFSRADPIDAMVKERYFREKLGVKVLQISESLDTDTNSGTYQIVRFMQAFAANEERNRIVDRTRSGIIYSLNSGRYCNIPPFGYKRGRDANGRACIVIDEENAPIVKAIFREYLKTGSIEETRAHARAIGYTVKGSSAIQKTLNNPLFGGLVNVPAYKNNPAKLVRGQHQAIVSEGTYWQVQEKLNGKGQTSHPSKDAFLRGVLNCHCGQKFTAAPSKGRHGNYYWYYFCKQHRKTNLSAVKLHAQFFEMLEEMSLDQETIDMVVARIKGMIHEELADKSRNIMQVRHKIGKVNNAIESIEEKYLLQPDISVATYKKTIAAQRSDLARLQDELNTLEQDNSVYYEKLTTIVIPALGNVQELFKSLPLHRQHAFIRLVFDQSLTYSQGSYRTPFLGNLFASKALILKEKGLLEVEQSSANFADSLAGSLPGSQVEPFFKELAALVA